VTRRRSQNDGADHSQGDHHTRSDILDVNARWNTLRQLDLLEGRIDIRSGAGAGGVAKGPGPLILIGQSRCWTNWPERDLASLFLRYGRLNKNPTLKNGELLPREGFCDRRNPQYEN
jgi:hypothetical protein